MNLRERVLQIGKPTPLVGVATEPALFDPGAPAVLILNSGVMHHVGACRLSVKIARAVAERGLLALRFDYSGIGDSEPRRGAESFELTSLAECAEVMDYLQRTRGVGEFILYGLCSGADAAYNTALEDARVIAMVQIDPYCYITPRYYIEHYRRAMRSPARWQSFLARQLRRLTGRYRKRSPSEVAGVEDEFFELPSYVRVFPPREQVAAGLTRLMRRGLHSYAIFTGGEPHYNHTGQYRASLAGVPFGDQLTEEYFPDSNHIITQPAQQRLIVERVAQWIQARARERAAAPPPCATATTDAARG